MRSASCWMWPFTAMARAVPCGMWPSGRRFPINIWSRIVTQLSRAGPGSARSGARGGYLLTREPEGVHRGEILRVLEGNLAPVSCVDQDDTCRCNRADRCVTVEVWRDIQAAVSSVGGPPDSGRPRAPLS